MEAVKREFELENATAKELAEAAASVLIEKKALDVRMYLVGEENPITDYYINVTGRSMTQVGALADDIVDKLSECGRDAVRVEGRRGDSWILVDYADVIIRSSKNKINIQICHFNAQIYPRNMTKMTY